MFNILDIFCQLFNVLVLHSFHYDKGERALMEFIHQSILTLDRVHTVGKVGQHIVVDAGRYHSDHRRDQKQQREDDDRHPQLYHSASQFHIFTFVCFSLLIHYIVIRRF